MKSIIFSFFLIIYIQIIYGKQIQCKKPTKISNVCGFTPPVNATMLSTYTDSNALCSSYQARLCTFEEMMSGISTFTGKNLNHHYVWTSTPCLSQTTTYMTLKYIGRKTICTNGNETKAFTRCCRNF